MTPVDLTTSAVGLTALALFSGAYLLVILEEVLHLRKSVPMLVAAGGVWGLVGWHYAGAAAAALPYGSRCGLFPTLHLPAHGACG